MVKNDNKIRRKRSSPVIIAFTVLSLIAVMMLFSGCNPEKNSMWFEHPTKKILSDHVDPDGKDRYTLYLARNEYESCQVAVNLSESFHDLRISAELKSRNGKNTGAENADLTVEIFNEHYVYAPKYTPFFQVPPEKEGAYEEYPDALSPHVDPVAVRFEETTPFYVTVHAGKNAEAGEYKFVINASAGGSVIDSCELTVRVWDFCLPDTPSMSAVSDVSAYQIAKLTGISGDELQSLFEKYYDFMAEHKVSPYSLPYDVLDERADRFMDDPRITGFRVSYGNDDYIRAVREKLMAKPERLKKAYFYFLDEPSTVESYFNLVSKSEHLLEIFPEARIVSPFFVDPDMPDGRDAIEYTFDTVNIWCPKLHCFDPVNLYNDSQRARLRPLRERLYDRRLAGEDLWTYVCWEPGEPYLNLYVNMPGVRHRLIFWQNYMLGANGFLYWSSNYWTMLKDPWTDMNTVKDLSPNVFGDGSLIYNGDKVGVFGACSSLRLEAVRDGIDDYEYMIMLEKLGVDRNEILRLVNQLTQSITEYTSDDDLLSRARIQMGNLIESRTRSSSCS